VQRLKRLGIVDETRRLATTTTNVDVSLSISRQSSSFISYRCSKIVAVSSRRVGRKLEMPFADTVGSLVVVGGKVSSSTLPLLMLYAHLGIS
jgi:hypothetical protein